jgi:hypothetical protein
MLMIGVLFQLPVYDLLCCSHVKCQRMGARVVFSIKNTILANASVNYPRGVQEYIAGERHVPLLVTGTVEIGKNALFTS